MNSLSKRSWLMQCVALGMAALLLGQMASCTRQTTDHSRDHGERSWEHSDNSWEYSDRNNLPEHVSFYYFSATRDVSVVIVRESGGWNTIVAPHGESKRAHEIDAQAVCDIHQRITGMIASGQLEMAGSGGGTGGGIECIWLKYPGEVARRYVMVPRGEPLPEALLGPIDDFIP